MDSKPLYFAAAVMILFIVVLWLSGKPVMSQAVPPDFSYEEMSLGSVTFSHKVHVTEKKLQCPDCHMKIFQMKKMAAASQMKMAKFNEGEFCGKCHDGEKAFTTKDSNNCSRCHIKK